MMVVVIFFKCLGFCQPNLSVITTPPYIRALKIGVCIMIRRLKNLKHFFNYRRYFTVSEMVFMEFIRLYFGGIQIYMCLIHGNSVKVFDYAELSGVLVNRLL